MVAKEASNNVDSAEFIIENLANSRLTESVERVRNDSARANELSQNIAEYGINLNQSNSLLESISLPDIEEKLHELNSKMGINNSTGNRLFDQIDELKRKINRAREMANTIKIGLTFFPNTTLELKSPESLPLLTTSTKISFYFSTHATNAFLLYLGNENKTNAPRVKSVSWENGITC